MLHFVKSGSALYIYIYICNQGRENDLTCKCVIGIMSFSISNV